MVNGHDVPVVSQQVSLKVASRFLAGERKGWRRKSKKPRCHQIRKDEEPLMPFLAGGCGKTIDALGAKETAISPEWKQDGFQGRP